MAREFICPIVNHPSDASMKLTVRLGETKLASHPPFAVAVHEGMAYVVPVVEPGEDEDCITPLLVLVETKDFPVEEDPQEETITKWWREASPKWAYKALKERLNETGVEDVYRDIQVAVLAPFASGSRALN